MPENTDPLADLDFVWGSGGHIEMHSHDGDEYAITFRLTEKGRAQIRKALLSENDTFLYADWCPHENPSEGDGIHVAGEPSDLICLVSPAPTNPTKEGDS